MTIETKNPGINIYIIICNQYPIDLGDFVGLAENSSKIQAGFNLAP